MKPTINSLLYVAMLRRGDAPGVKKKIDGTIRGAIKIGYKAKSKIIEPGSISSYYLIMISIMFAKEKIILVRYFNQLGFIVFISGIVLRIRGRSLFLDIPTPMKNHMREVLARNGSIIKNLISSSLIVAQGPIPFISAHRIIQYSNEGSWFSILVRKRTIKMGNGIDVENIPARLKKPPWPNHTLELVAVGTICHWHGLDRLIQAIDKYNNSDAITFRISLKIIGDGPSLEYLKLLVKTNKQESDIKFMGMLYGDRLFKEYSKSHFGVGSLGWHRIGVHEASPLKIREYLAIGMPVIAATQDPDFPGVSELYLRVKNEEEIDSIIALFNTLASYSMPTISKCRDYSQKHLDYKRKMELLLPPILL